MLNTNNAKHVYVDCKHSQRSLGNNNMIENDKQTLSNLFSFQLRAIEDRK